SPIEKSISRLRSGHVRLLNNARPALVHHQNTRRPPLEIRCDSSRARSGRLALLPAQKREVFPACIQTGRSPPIAASPSRKNQSTARTAAVDPAQSPRPTSDR